MSEIYSTADASVYVGTYKKYNEGSLFGKWLKLADYSDKQEFYDACRELHKDEQDPEFMFQDWEHIPDGLIGESWIYENVWSIIDLDDDDAEILVHYCSAFSVDFKDYDDISDLVREAKEKYIGNFDSLEELGEHYADMLGDIPKHLENYIDWEKYGQSFAEDLYEDDGYYFDPNM